MSKIKVCVVTGARSEYGLLRALMHALNTDNQIDLRVVVTGMHMSPEFGSTYKQIEKDGFEVDDYVEMVLSSDSSVGVAKSIGVGVIGVSDCLRRMAPDLVIILGDRYEAFAVAQTALIMSVPVAHIHGGELTEGALDDSFRHAITKMSHLHFVATEEFRKRVIQLGEDPSRVHKVGALGVDIITSVECLGVAELEDALNTVLHNEFMLVTYHPVTLSNSTESARISNLIAALESYKHIKKIITYPNADAGGRVLLEALKMFSQKDHSVYLVPSLDHQKYISLMKHSTLVVGNSSSGLIEAPSLGIPSVNIGERQKGRPLAKSVISCGDEENEIVAAIEKALSVEFREVCRSVINPYGNGNAVSKIMKVVKEIKPREIKNKSFYDVNFKVN